jgi:hypothetical protein
MSWITITEDLVQTRAAGSELTALKNSARGSGQTGSALLEDVISQAVDKVRGYCATAVKGGHLSAMGDSGTVPSRLLSVTLNLIRYELITRLPGLSATLLDEGRKDQHRMDEQLLRDVAAGRFAIEDPTQPETTVAAPTPSISPRTLSHRREDAAGL